MKSFNLTMSHRRAVNTGQPANQPTRREHTAERRARRKAMQCPWWGCEMSLWVATSSTNIESHRDEGRCAL